MAREGEHDIQGYERVFNVIGWLGFIAVVPIALKIFGLPEAQAFLAEKLGRYGSTGFLLLYFFVLVLVRVIFGSGRIIMPLVIASLSGFVFLSVSAGVPFMDWLRELAADTVYFGNMPLNFLTGIAVVLLGIALSYLRRLSVIVQLLVLVVLPVAFLVVAGATGFLGVLRDISLSAALPSLC